MKEKENIIAIRNRSITEANKAFDDFMSKTEKCFNERSKANPKLYKGISSGDLEIVTEQILKEIAPQTPFRKEEIRLVAGHSFPDIMSEKYYGVEVKSTKEDKWTSTGSSIVETTRDQFVENIYMLFGKLGGNPPAFKCRPYQDCLSNIAVTHSPRYIIDMEIKDKKSQTIFDKLNVSYDEFSQDENKIEIVRDYYIRQSRKEGKHEMPWWVGKKTIETDYYEDIPAIQLMNNKSADEIKWLKAEMVILFPQVINGDYSEAALWLCTHRYLLSLNLRDLFSAGGQWNSLNGKKLDIPLPAVFGKLMEIALIIKKILTSDYYLEIAEFNSSLNENGNKYEAWLNQVDIIFKNYTYQVGSNKKFRFSSLNIPVKEYLSNPDNYILSKSVTPA